MDTFDARMKTPFTCLVSGSPLSGKTTFVKKLLQLRHKLINNDFDYLLWCYGQDTPFIKSLQDQCIGIHTTTHFGIPTSFDTHIQPQKRGLVVIDDLMQSAGSSVEVTNLFCNRVQHENVSVILLLQNLFHHGKERVTLLRCAHYLVVFRNPLDATIPFNLAQRILPSNRRPFLDLFEFATSKPHGYLFIDGHQTTPPEARFRTKLFDDNVQHVFVLTSDRSITKQTSSNDEEKRKKTKKDEEGTSIQTL